jgi:hemolysin activation/secretion protein
MNLFPDPIAGKDGLLMWVMKNPRARSKIVSRSVKRLILLSALLSLFPLHAFAVDIPGSAEPSRVHGQMAPPVAPQRPEAAVSPAPVETTAAPEGADKITFILKSVTITGMSVYKEADVLPLYQPMLGKTVSLVQIYALADRLTAKYRNAGYILSQVIVPPQTIDGGRIRLQAVEGYVDRITLNSDTPGEKEALAPYGSIVTASRPLKAAALERYLLVINDLPGMNAKSVLSPSPKTPGASSLLLTVDHKSYDASVQTDNRGSLYMGPQQYNVSLSLNNILHAYEGISLQVADAPHEMGYVGVNVSRPVGYKGAIVNVGGSVTSTAPGFTLKQFGVKGLSRTYTAGITYPFIRSRSENLYGTAKFDYLNSERSDNLGLGVIEDRLRVLRLNGLYQTADHFQGSDSLTVELSRGIDIFNAKPQGSPNMTRVFGTPEFFKATFDASRVQALTQMFDLFTSAAGQWSADPLLASEEFGVGGAAYGSAYDSSEITGRHGLSGRIELRANDPIATPLQKLQAYGFYDIGKVWDPQGAAAKDRIRSLASTGLGLRLAVNDTVSGSCELAIPLTRKVETEQNTHPRLFGALTAKF